MGDIASISIFLLLLGAVITVSLGVVVIIQSKPISAARWWFGAICASAASWMLTNALFKIVGGQQQYMIALASYAAAAILAMSIAVFCMHIAGRPTTGAVVLVVAIGVALAVIGSAPGLLATGVHEGSIRTNAAVSPIYGIGIAGLILSGVGVLAGSLRRASKRHLRSGRYILAGLAAAAAVGLTANLILPIGFDSYDYVEVGPLGVIFFILTSAYAIVRHGLFDVRIAAVRTLAYVLSLLSMAGVYFGLAYIVSSTLFQGTSTAGVSMSPVNIGLALVLAFIFQPIKQFFDRVTNRIFFRDRYDRDRFISQLGDILTSTTTLRTMLDRAARHIQDSLNAAHTAFIVFREDKPAIIVGSQDKPALKKDDLDSITAYIGGQKQVMVIDDVHEEINSAEERRVRKLLRKHRVALILPLSDQTGYLLLGDQKASGYTKRDIRVLETISNELVIAIQNARSVEEVRLLNATLQQSIDEATSELRRSNEKLRKLDATKDEFVSMASHQLRTPLTSIKGYISMLLEGDAGKISKQQEKLLKEAFNSSERMVRLISDFLNVSRLQTGKFMIDAYPVDLARVIGDEIESIRSMAVSHGQTLSYFGPKTLPDVMIDEDKTRQVVMNFIDNAIYYSPAGSDISVKLKTERGKVVFEVHDHGIGVPKHVQSQLFTKFFRAENARKQRPDGTGVGLYLAKRVIEAQGGEIIFHSRPGMGSVFGFRLPLKK